MKQCNLLLGVLISCSLFSCSEDDLVTEKEASFMKYDIATEQKTTFLRSRRESNIIRFEDSEFKKALIDESVDKNDDGEIQKNEAEAITELYVDDYKIKSLKGIEFFTNLLKLDCSENELVNLDISKNIKLEQLLCKRNQLIALDLSENRFLSRVKCQGNKLTCIQVADMNKVDRKWRKDRSAYWNTNCNDDDEIIQFEDINFKKALVSDGVDKNQDGEIQKGEAKVIKRLYVENKGLKSITEVEFFVNLEKLYCFNNQLAILDVSKNLKLLDLRCNRNQLTNLNISKNANLEVLTCSDNQLTNIDVSKNNNLQILACSNNRLTSLGISKNIKLHKLSCYDNQIISLDVSKNINLISLDCSRNQLSSLDVSKSTELKWLDLTYNELLNLDVSKNIKLNILYCGGNELLSLDVSKNLNLRVLYCFNNQLTSLDISKNLNIKTVYCYMNSNLTCIKVPDVALAKSSKWRKDKYASFSISCSN